MFENSSGSGSEGWLLGTDASLKYINTPRYNMTCIYTFNTSSWYVIHYLH